MKQRFTRLISTILALAMLAELLPANLLGSLIPWVSASEFSSSLGFAGLPQPEPLPTTVDTDPPPTIIIGEDKPSANLVPELEAQLRAQAAMVAPMASSTEETEETEETDENSSTPGINAPYTFDSAVQEQVNLNTGELTYLSNDYVLPGVNGLDLTIGRVYLSHFANHYYIDPAGHPTELAEADQSVLGQGWSFAFPSIITFQNLNGTQSHQYVRLEDGTLLRIKSYVSNRKKLEGYAPNINKELQILRTNGVITYQLSYLDGRKDTFNANGRLISMQDAFGNEIHFSYDTLNGYERITITDTLNRTVVISSANDTDGNVITTVSLPENITLSYKTLRQTTPFSYGALESYTNAVGQIEQYSYRLDNGRYSSLEDETDYFVNLSTITHPTGATTNYLFGKRTCWAYKTRFSRDCYKVTTRYDVIGRSIYNRKLYLYSSTDSTGYPNTSLSHGYTYSVTVRNIARLANTYEFGYDASGKAIYKESVTFNDKPLYDQDGDVGYTVSPTWKKYYNQSDSSITFSTKAHSITRDEYGNILTEHIGTAGSSASGTQLQSNTYEKNLLKEGNLYLDQDQVLKTKNTIGYSNSKITATEILLNNQRKSYTQFVYDESTGNLLQTQRCINPDEQLASNRKYVTVSYSYQDNAYLSQVTQTGVLTADGEAAVGSPGQADGTIVAAYGYDTLGRMISTTDSNGNITTYSYDALGNLVQITNPDQTTIQYVRDYTNNTLTVTNENGAQTQYTYTALGLLQDTIDVQTGNILSRRTYNGLSQLSTLTDYVYGSVTNYTYDSYDNVASETVLQEDEILSQTTYTHNEVTADGQYLKNTTTVLGGDGAPSIITTEYLDSLGNIAKTGRIFNGVEYFDTFTYNYHGDMLTKLTAADAEKGLPFTQKYEYHYDGQVSKTFNADNQVLTNTYDALGRLVQTTDYAGTPTMYSYDVLDRLLSQTQTIEDGNTVTLKYDYDPVGNLTRESWPVQGYGSNTRWSERRYVYGNRNQRLQTVELYDWDALASTTSYTYDGVGNLTSTTTHGKTTSYTYDRYGNVISVTDPLQQTETYAYNALGKIISRTDRNQQTTTYGYDAMGRLVSETVGTDYRQRTYTRTGHTATEQNNWYLTSYTYDDAGRIASVSETEQQAADGNPNNLLQYTKSYAYDRSDNRVSFVLTKGSTVIQNAAYTYDNLNRLSTVSENGIQQAAYTYDVNGNRATLTYANGVVEDYTYNKANWVTSITNRLGDTVLSSYAYTYYPTGNQETKTDHTGKKTTYIYDGLGRLEQEYDNAGLNICYFYDASHNRSSMTYRDSSENYELYYTYNANNQLTEERKRQNGKYTTVASYTYDGNGNQLTKLGTDGTSFQAYNGFNQLTSHTVGAATTHYAYNAAGIRTSKVMEGSRSSYLLDGSYITAELRAGEAAPIQYLWGGSLLRMAQGSNASYYLYNAHGDVVSLANQAGGITRTYDYSAFGIEENPDTEDLNPFRYCGEYFDGETGTYYLRARYYDPATGRFTQADSVRYIYRDLPNKASVIDPLSLNHYTYCANNPNRYCDPGGHMPVDRLNEISMKYNSGEYTPKAVSEMTLMNNAKSIYTGFHEIAQLNVAKQLYNNGTPAILEYKLKDIGEVDIVAGTSAWEVKPIRNYRGPKQLRKYTTGTGLTAGWAIDEILDIPIIDNIKMGVRSTTRHPGIIQYFFYQYDENGDRISVASSAVKEKYEAAQKAAAAQKTVTYIIRGVIVLTVVVAVASTVAAPAAAPALLTTAAGFGAQTDIADIITALQKAA